MQRWMEAKVQLAKRHGTMRSGCNRPTGECWDDVKTRSGTIDQMGWFHPVSKNNGAANVKRRVITKRPNRAERRAHLQK